MYMKRVILANQPRLLSEMFHRALARAENLEVVHEVFHDEELAHAIQRFCPEWVIVSLPIPDPTLNWITTLLQDHSPVRFVFLSFEHHMISMKWRINSEQDISDLSIKEFIHLLEKDRQPN